jgi:hypothetical protein
MNFIKIGDNMKIVFLLTFVMVSLVLISLTKSEPDFNGTSPGCGGSSCHATQSGLVTATVLNNFQIRITVSGTTSKVGGELVNSNNEVVAVINSTSSNPFILTAPSAGTYVVNAGFNNPDRDWGSTSAVIQVTGVDDQLIGIKPESFKLFTNYPNPFNPVTKIRYSIVSDAFTTLKVFSIIGEEVVTLISEEKTPGVYEVNFNGFKLSSGTYIVKLQAGKFVETKKMILLK